MHIVKVDNLINFAIAICCGTIYGTQLPLVKESSPSLFGGAGV
jgi:hypothetical protein